MNNLKKVNNFMDVHQKIKIESIKVEHGKINCICYKVNDICAYASDVSKIHKKDYYKFTNLKYFIIDTLRYDPHPSHYNLNQILDLVKIIKPQKTILTNLNNEMDYDDLKKKLPKNIVPGYDGMSFLI